MFKNEEGSVIIELAIFIVLICGLLFGLMNIMSGVKTSIALQTAAREGARAYATTGNVSIAKNKAEKELNSLGVATATISPSAQGSLKSVTVTKNISYTIPLFGAYNKTLKGYCAFHQEPIFAEGS